MLRFFDLERIDAKKRDVVERTKDFKEIYEKVISDKIKPIKRIDYKSKGLTKSPDYVRLTTLLIK